MKSELSVVMERLESRLFMELHEYRVGELKKEAKTDPTFIAESLAELDEQEYQMLLELTERYRQVSGPVKRLQEYYKLLLRYKISERERLEEEWNAILSKVVKNDPTIISEVLRSLEADKVAEILTLVAKRHPKAFIEALLTSDGEKLEQVLPSLDPETLEILKKWASEKQQPKDSN